VKDVRREVDGGELGVGNLDPFGIFFLIQFGADLQSAAGSARSKPATSLDIAFGRLEPAQIESSRHTTASDPLLGIPSSLSLRPYPTP
jgi:hypothetical protein